MNQNEFHCVSCGYKPSDSPVGGSWYCPKCGKKTQISSYKPKTAKKYHPKPNIRKVSRDQVLSRIYDNLVHLSDSNLGLKEPYLNPSIPPIEPKERKKIRIFIKKTKKLE